MARPTKQQRQAKLQRASSAKAFDNGFVENLLEIALDPDYQPESDTEDRSNADLPETNEMSFCLMDDIDSKDGADDTDEDNLESEVDPEITCIGVSKRRRMGNDELEDALAQFEAAEETDDYVEKCARQAATTAHRFWADIMRSVCITHWYTV